MPFRRMLAPLLILAAALACGGGGSVYRSGAATGTLTVRFGSDSFPGYDQAVVSIEKLEGTLDGATWTSLGTVQATYDLMSLQSGYSTVILPATSVPAGTYSQFRITWATVNYSDGRYQAAYVLPTGALTGPALAMPTTTVVPGPVTVPTGGSVTAQIMLSGQQAVQARAGTSPYTFQATGQAYNAAATARIAGSAYDGSTPLAGVEVFAETVDGTGLATIQRRAFTDASGSYVLEALPTGGVYFVVAQPAGDLSAYPAMASDPVSAASATSYAANLAFSGPQTPGALTLTLTPASTAAQGTWGELRQTLAAGSTTFATLIVRSQTVASGLVQDQAGFSGLAPGLYGVTSQRSTSGGAPVMQSLGSLVTVSSGGTATATLSYP